MTSNAETKRYLAIATSPGNVWARRVVIEAKNVVEAQDKFFAWLKTEPVYTHMWRLDMQLELLDDVEYGVIR